MEYFSYQSTMLYILSISRIICIIYWDFFFHAVYIVDVHELVDDIVDP